MQLSTISPVVLIILAVTLTLVAISSKRLIQRDWAITRCKNLYKDLWRKIGEDNADKAKIILSEIRRYKISPHRIDPEIPKSNDEAMAYMATLYVECVKTDKYNHDDRIAEESDQLLERAADDLEMLLKAKIGTEQAHICVDRIKSIVCNDALGISYQEIGARCGTSLGSTDHEAADTLNRLLRIAVICDVTRTFDGFEKQAPSLSADVAKVSLELLTTRLGSVDIPISDVIDQSRLQPIVMKAYGYERGQPPKTEAATANGGGHVG